MSEREHAADADVSSILPIIPYGGFSPVRLEGGHIRRDLPHHSKSGPRLDPTRPKPTSDERNFLNGTEHAGDVRADLANFPSFPQKVAYCAALLG